MPAIREYRACEDRLDALFAMTGDVSRTAGNEVLVAEMAKYLCVLTSGYLEIAVFEILTTYAARCSNGQVSRFVARKLSRLPNMKMAAIKGLLEDFSEDWARDLLEYCDGEIADSVNSIVNQRQNIAHGRQSDVSLVRMDSYYRAAKRMIRKLCVLALDDPD